MVMKQALNTGLTKVICGLPASLFHVTGRQAEERGETIACPIVAKKIDRFGLKILLHQCQVLKNMTGFPMFTILQKWSSAL